jgi:hypothetical protein
MDIFKFVILSVACVSGFMTISYEGVAQQRGWGVGSSYMMDRLGFLSILGFLCLWGSVIISFFVNPWWSAFLVLIIGFVGNMILTILFGSYTQLLAIPLVIGSFILVSLYVFPSSTPIDNANYDNTTSNIGHFSKSIGHSNSALKIADKFRGKNGMDLKSLNKFMESLNKALSEAKKVDTQKINENIQGFEYHYRREFIKGLELVIKGAKKQDLEMYIEGNSLFNDWIKWYSHSYDNFGKYYDDF